MEKEMKKKLLRFADVFRQAQETGRREADIVMYLIEFLKDVLGYNVFNEISKEYQVKDKYCDIAIKLNGQVAILIEAKQPGLRLVDRHIEQAENYAMRSGTEWVILTNGCEWRLFHLSFNEETGVDRAIAFKTDLLQCFQDAPAEVISKFLLLHKKNVAKSSLTKYWKMKTLLTPQSLLGAVFSTSVLKAIARDLNRGATVRVGLEDIVKALKNMLDKEVLADMADIKIKKAKTRRPRATPTKKPKGEALGSKQPEAVLGLSTKEVKLEASVKK